MKACVKKLSEILVHERWSEIYTMLLKIITEKVKGMRHRDIWKNYHENPLTRPSTGNAKEILKIDSLLANMLPKKFDFIELSPVVPIGSSGVLTKISQKTILSTIKNVELMADATLALALESTRRRMVDSSTDINLATSCRMLRLQGFGNRAGFTPHFRGFAITSAGSGLRHSEFEFTSLSEHIRYWINALQSLAESEEYFLKDVHIAISDMRIMEGLVMAGFVDREKIVKWIRTKENMPFDFFQVPLPTILDSMINIGDNFVNIHTLTTKGIGHLRACENTTIKALKTEFPDIHFFFHLERSAGLGYHAGLCFKISSINIHGMRLSLVDGGVQSWAKILLQRNKEKFFSSGFGTELFCKQFRNY